MVASDGPMAHVYLVGNADLVFREFNKTRDPRDRTDEEFPRERQSVLPPVWDGRQPLPGEAAHLGAAISSRTVARRFSAFLDEEWVLLETSGGYKWVSPGAEEDWPLGSNAVPRAEHLARLSSPDGRDGFIAIPSSLERVRSARSGDLLLFSKWSDSRRRGRTPHVTYFALSIVGDPDSENATVRTTPSAFERYVSHHGAPTSPEMIVPLLFSYPGGLEVGADFRGGRAAPFVLGQTEFRDVRVAIEGEEPDAEPAKVFARRFLEQWSREPYNSSLADVIRLLRPQR